MAGKYRLTFFKGRAQPRVARPGEPPTRSRAGDGAHVSTRLSTTAEERTLDVTGQPATVGFQAQSQ